MSGLLTEDEIREYLFTSFGVKLDKDSFAKPTKDLVKILYTRFLDEILPNWRKNDKELNDLALILRGIRNLLSGLDLDFTFECTDIVYPKRKRLISILNVLIYLRALHQESMEIAEQRKELYVKNKEESEELQREQEQIEIEIEELRNKLENSRPIDEIVKEIDAKSELFQEAKKKCDTLGERTKILKATKNDLFEKNAKHRTMIKDLEEKLADLESTYKLLEDDKAVEEDLNSLLDGIRTKSKLVDQLEEKIRQDRKIDLTLNEQLKNWTTFFEEVKLDTTKEKQQFEKIAYKGDQLAMLRDQNNRELDKIIAENQLLEKEISKLDETTKKRMDQFKIERAEDVKKLDEKKYQLEKYKRDMEEALKILESENEELQKQVVLIKSKEQECRIKTKEKIDDLRKKYEMIVEAHEKAKIESEEVRQAREIYMSSIIKFFNEPDLDKTQQLATNLTYIKSQKE